MTNMQLLCQTFRRQTESVYDKHVAALPNISKADRKCLWQTCSCFAKHFEGRQKVFMTNMQLLCQTFRRQTESVYDKHVAALPNISKADRKCLWQTCSCFAKHFEGRQKVFMTNMQLLCQTFRRQTESVYDKHVAALPNISKADRKCLWQTCSCFAKHFEGRQKVFMTNMQLLCQTFRRQTESVYDKHVARRQHALPNISKADRKCLWQTCSCFAKHFEGRQKVFMTNM